LKVPTSQYYHYLPPFLQNYYQISILLSFFPTTKADHSFLLKKLVGTSILKIELKIMFGEKEENFDHPSSPFKEKEKESEGRSKAWWPMEGEGEGFLLPLSIFDALPSHGVKPT